MKKLFVLSLALFIIISCGDKKKKNKQIKQIKSTESTVAYDSKTNNNVIITAGDDMRYNIKKITVKSGQKVTLTLKHIGKMNKQIMGHNFVLLKSGVNMTDFAQKAIQARDTDYIPENGKQTIAHTRLLGGGETDTIEFEVKVPGKYRFLCSFPGHVGVMQGWFIVE